MFHRKGNSASLGSRYVAASGDASVADDDHDKKSSWRRLPSSGRTLRLWMIAGVSLWIFLRSLKGKILNFASSELPIVSNGRSGGDQFHLVFSTGCSVFQDWQSYVFFYHVHKSGQSGKVTRIVSGCTTEQRSTLEKLHKEQIQSISMDFMVHFTPDYTFVKPGTEFKYFNKPFGMKHWMEHALGYDPKSQSTSTKYDDTIIILLDPDQMLLKPFVSDYSKLRMDWTPQEGGASNVTAIPKIVQRGTQISQQYGFGRDWLSRMNISHILGPTVHPNDSPLSTMKLTSANRYAPGPPYMAVGRDMYSIVKKWTEFAPRVHDCDDSILAEMYAYSLASVQVHLQPWTARGFMVSNTLDGYEGWYLIDEMEESKICTPPDKSPSRESSMPFVIHYCQFQTLGDHQFLKYLVPKDFMSCQGQLLKEPTKEILKSNKGINLETQKYFEFRSKKRRKREAWMLCSLLPALNEAMEHFKQNQCGKQANFNKVAVAGVEVEQ